MSATQEKNRSIHRKKKIPYSKIIITFILFIGGILMIFPLLWMLSTSLRSTEEFYNAGINLIVKEVHWENYSKALMAFPFFTYFKNTLIITLTSVVFMCVSSSLAAYGFARYTAPGSKILFMIMLATMMLPGQVTMIPRFILFKNIGWINTLLPLFAPSLFGSAFNIFLVRQFYMQLPQNLDEAARIDGCNDFLIWSKIYLPLSKPVLATVAIFEFVGKWNDFMDPLIYINSDSKKTLALGLQSFVTENTTDMNLLMAASLVVIAPCIILFFCFQNQFIAGVSIGSEK